MSVTLSVFKQYSIDVIAKSYSNTSLLLYSNNSHVINQCYNNYDWHNEKSKKHQQQHYRDKGDFLDHVFVKAKSSTRGTRPRNVSEL